MYIQYNAVRIEGFSALLQHPMNLNLCTELF